jgi:hypothetical protein
MITQSPVVFPLGAVRLVYSNSTEPGVAVTAQLFDCDSLSILEAAAEFTSAGFGYYYLDRVYDSPRRIFVTVFEDGEAKLRFLLRVVVYVTEARTGV